MKKIFLLALSSLIFAVSCSKDDGQGDGGNENQPAVTLITPDVSVRIADPLSSNPFTGALEIYPCDEASSIYSVNLYKEYTSLKSRKLEELPRFRVMSWQPF